MGNSRDFLRENDFFARAVTFGLIPFCWRISIALGRWFGYEHSVLLIGIVGIWVGVVIGHQLYYRWIFPEKRKAKEN